MAFLDDNRPAPSPTPPARDERTCLTVLVVAAEVDFRRYVRECLRERADLRLLEAASVAAAVDVAAQELPTLLIVDEPAGEVSARLSQIRAIMIVDDVPRGGTAAGIRVRRLARPFSAETLVAEVGRILG